MNREMAALFPNGIRALIVDDDARFIKSSSMLLSLLNIKVTSCRSPTSALKFFSGDKNKDVDVVLINAEMATTCGFDFRGIVETDLGIPVIYFLSRDHVATGDEADELLRTLRDATYILRSPLEANEVCDLWMVIAWRKCYLEKKAKGAAADGRHVVPAAAVQAYMASGRSSSNTPVDEEREEHEDRVHFKVVGAGSRRSRACKRKSGRNTVAGAGSSGTTVIAGDQAAKRKGKTNVTAENEGDDAPSQQQAAATQAATTIEATATTTPHWNQNQPAAGNVVFGNNIAPPTGVANMATTVTSEPEFSRDGNQQQQQQKVVCPQLMFGPFPYQGPRPPPMLTKQAMSVPLPRYSGTDAAAAGATVGASAAAGAAEYGNAATSLLPTLNHSTETDDGHDDELAAMMAAYTDESNHPPAVADAEAATAALYNTSSALMALPRQHIGHSVAANMAEAMDYSYINYSAAAAGQEVLDNGDDFSTSIMAPNNQVLDMASNVNELTMAGGAFFSDANDGASFTAPRDLAAAADGDQLAPGALDALSASLMGSPPGPGAAMDGNPGLELEDAMFSPDQYDNTMFPLEALLGLDEAPVYEAGMDYQQGGAAGGAAGDDAAGTSFIGGADDNLDVNDYFLMDSTGDLNNGRE